MLGWRKLERKESKMSQHGSAEGFVKLWCGYKGLGERKMAVAFEADGKKLPIFNTGKCWEK